MDKAQKNVLASAFRSPHLLLPLIYLVLGLLLMKHYQIMWKDEISYISIAEKYARGDFVTAVNALWGPLLPWLLAGLILLGLPSVLGAKLLSLMIGVFTFFSARSISYRFEMSDRLRGFLLFATIPILLYCSLIFFLPDLLLVGLLTFYFSIILSPKYADRAYAGGLCGMLGALAYFSKAYAFFFFFIHFMLINSLYYVKSTDPSTKRDVLRNCALGLVVFFVLTAGWIYMLNLKYHEVTIGISGRYNHAIRGPDSQGRPLQIIGFVPPSDATAISIWEDPYYFYAQPDAVECCLKPWSLLDSWRAFKHQIKLILTSVQDVVSIYNSLSVLTITIIVAAIFLCIARSDEATSRTQLALGLLTLGSYSAGYALMHTEQRYLWPIWMLILFMGGHILHVLFKTRFPTHEVQKALAILLFSASFWTLPLWVLYRSANLAQTTQIFNRQLANAGLNGAKIASNENPEMTINIAHHVQARYYGNARYSMSENEVVEELRKHGIRYYFVWDGARVESAALEKVNEYRVADRSLAIYSVKY